MLAHALSDRVCLRLLEEGDAEELYAVIVANRERLARWMPWAEGQTLQGTRDFIRLTRRQLADNDGLQTAIVQDGAIVGMIGLHGVDWLHRNTSVGYWLAEQAEGRGIVTEAVRAYTTYALQRLGLERIELQTALDNTRSRAVAERLGFTEEGVLRHVFRVGDRWLDHVVFSMLAADWRHG